MADTGGQLRKKFRKTQANREKNYPLHFLLVDDDNTYHKMMTYRFKILNWKATSLFNGKEAVELYRKNGFQGVDVILMDKEMPVMAGEEATTRLVSMGCKTPIIALSASGHNYVMKGAMGALQKPLQIPNLLHALIRGRQTMASPSELMKPPAKLVLNPNVESWSRQDVCRELMKPPAKVVLNPNVRSWSSQDVCRWLTTLGNAYRVYTPAFVDNGITGQMLLSLNHPSHYATLGVTNNLHIRRINLGVRWLRTHVLQRRKLAGKQPQATTRSDGSMMEEEPMGDDIMMEEL